MYKKLRVVVGVSVFASIHSLAFADLDEGRSAYKEKNYGKALSEFRAEASKGNGEAQTLLAKMYLEGEGVKQNPKEAAKLARAAANKGMPQAQVLLGDMYENGLGVPKSKVEAMKWYTLAADQGDEDGRSNVSRLTPPSTQTPAYEQHSNVQRQPVDTARSNQVYQGSFTSHMRGNPAFYR